MFTEETCTTCKTPHPAGRYICDGCNATFSTIGASSSYPIVDEKRQAVVEVTRRWAYCPLCGTPTRLKDSTTRRVVHKLAEPQPETAERAS